MHNCQFWSKNTLILDKKFLRMTKVCPNCTPWRSNQEWRSICADTVFKHSCLSVLIWRHRRHPVLSHFRVSSCSEFQKPSHTAAEREEAKLRVLDFKTTWSEFQKPSQTTTERGEAKLCILNFKTKWSEFHKLKQKLLQTAFHSLFMWF